MTTNINANIHSSLLESFCSIEGLKGPAFRCYHPITAFFLKFFNMIETINTKQGKPIHLNKAQLELFLAGRKKSSSHGLQDNVQLLVQIVKEENRTFSVQKFKKAFSALLAKLEEKDIDLLTLLGKLVELCIDSTEEKNIYLRLIQEGLSLLKGKGDRGKGRKIHRARGPFAKLPSVKGKLKKD